MAKTSEKLSKKEVEKMFYKLCVVIAKTNNAEDAAKLLRDLLSFTEAEIIAKRIKIAEMLMDDATYQEIIEKLKVGSTTIFKVQEWLKISGDGYRKAIAKTKGKELKKIQKISTYNPEDWMAMKKRFPTYYWPEILLENIIVTANKRQRSKINTVLRQMKKMKSKDNLYKRIEAIMKRGLKYGQTKN